MKLGKGGHMLAPSNPLLKNVFKLLSDQISSIGDLAYVSIL